MKKRITNLIIGIVFAVILYAASLVISSIYPSGNSVLWIYLLSIISIYFVLFSFKRQSIAKGMLSGLIVGAVLTFLFFILDPLVKSGKIDCINFLSGPYACNPAAAVLNAIAFGAIYFMIQLVILGLIIGLIVYFANKRKKKTL